MMDIVALLTEINYITRGIATEHSATSVNIHSKYVEILSVLYL